MIMFYNDILPPLMAIRFLFHCMQQLAFLPPAISETQPDSLSLVSNAEFITSQMKKDLSKCLLWNLDEYAAGTVMGIWITSKSLQSPKKIFYSLDLWNFQKILLIFQVNSSYSWDSQQLDKGNKTLIIHF